MNITIEQALQKAIDAQKDGRFQDAEALYKVILQTEPRHPDANHNLGILAASVNKTAAALTLLKTALEENPKQGQFWISYIDALIKEKQFDNATKVLEQGRKLGLTGERVNTLEANLKVINLSQGHAEQAKKSLTFTQQRKKISVKKEEKTNKKNQIRLDKNRNPSLTEVTALTEQYQNGQYDSAENLAKKLIKQYPYHQFAWKVLGAVFSQIGKLQDSLIANQRALEILPNDAEAHANLGITLQVLGKLEEAEKSYKKALAIKPDYAEAHYNLGITLQELSRLEDAEESYKKAILIKPDFAEAHANLGITLQELGKLEGAEISHKKVIAIKPDLAEAHNNLGNTLQKLGKLEEAEKSYKKAIAIKPDYAEAHNNLGITLQELGKPEDALEVVIKSLKIKKTSEAKFFFMEVIKKLCIKNWDQSVSQLVTTAILEPWGRPSFASLFACRLLREDKEFVRILIHSNNGIGKESFDDIFLNKIRKKEFDSFPLLQAMLTSAPIPDTKLEVFLTNLRKHLLKIASSVTLKEDESNDEAALYCSLAQQCFINEYVFYQTTEEIDDSQSLRGRLIKALESQQQVPANWIIAVACYFPLYTVTGSKKLLLQKYSNEVENLLLQQIQEPLDELNFHKSILVLSKIDNQVSLKVQSQYEEHPYPRWVRLPKDSSKKSLNTYIQNKFPFSSFQRLLFDSNPDILVAGCGTGQQPIETSQKIKGARILGIDLSSASLAYAKRKTSELNINNVDYAQADIVKLVSLSRTFDLIESSGVLHHLENPFEGWEVLVSLLRPNGLMRLGFYSEIARRDIVRVRNMISKANIGSSSQDIRDYRKHLLGLKNSDGYGLAIKSIDFFSTSACRDLLFHVQEHRMNLNIINKFLKDHELNFLGFEIDHSVIQAYKERFSNDSSATNLDQWHLYEEENPDTFSGMYQFYVQKK